MRPAAASPNGLVGTAIMVAIATAIALPVGILAAVYVAEFSRTQAARVVRLALDVLNGVPSIVIGIFAYALLWSAPGTRRGRPRSRSPS